VPHIETLWARQTKKKIDDHNKIIRTEYSRKGFCYHSVKRAISTGFRNNETRVIGDKRIALFDVSCGVELWSRTPRKKIHFKCFKRNDRDYRQETLIKWETEGTDYR
jgi:hypothetical protein